MSREIVATGKKGAPEEPIETPEEAVPAENNSDTEIDEELREEIMALRQEISATRREANDFSQRTEVLKMMNKTMQSLAGVAQSVDQRDEEKFDRSTTAIKGDMQTLLRTAFGMMGQSQKGRVAGEKLGEVLDATLGLLDGKFHNEGTGTEEEDSFATPEVLEAFHLRYPAVYQSNTFINNLVSLERLSDFLKQYHQACESVIRRVLRSDRHREFAFEPQVETGDQSDPQVSEQAVLRVEAAQE